MDLFLVELMVFLIFLGMKAALEFHRQIQGKNGDRQFMAHGIIERVSNRRADDYGFSLGV